jgi:hypothetical protein
MKKAIAGTEILLTVGILIAAGVTLVQLKGVFYGQQLLAQEEVVVAFAKDLESIADKATATTGDASFIYHPAIKKYTVDINSNVVLVFDKVSKKAASFSKSSPEIIDNYLEDCEKIFVVKREEKIVVMCRCLELGESCGNSLLCCSDYCNETSKKCEEIPICPAERVCPGAPGTKKDSLGNDCCPTSTPACTGGHCCPTDKPNWCNRPETGNPRCMNDGEIESDCKHVRICDDPQPSSFDWRNVDGKNWLSPVRNQGYCGSCWAFSAIGPVEGTYNIEQETPGANFDLSEQDLVSCSGAGSCGGGFPWTALQYIKNSGVCDEACFPYRAADVSCSRCSNVNEKLWTVEEYAHVAGMENIKRALTCYGPLSIAVMPWPGSNQGHAITLVGYDDSGGYWIFKNSWGTGWGSGGYGTLRYGTNGIESYVFYVRGVKQK